MDKEMQPAARPVSQLALMLVYRPPCERPVTGFPIVVVAAGIVRQRSIVRLVAD